MQQDRLFYEYLPNFGRSKWDTNSEVCGREKHFKTNKNPNAEWKTPTLTTFKKGSHAIRSKKYRYIRYKKGGEELYDEINAPYEWKNLISANKFNNEKAELSKYFSKINKKPIGNNGKKASE